MMKMHKLMAKGKAGGGLALLAGMLLTLAFAPFNLFPLAILAPAILLALWLKVTAQQAFWRGWLFGLGLFGTGVYWVYISIHTFGGVPGWLASLITFGFIAILALYPALTGYILNRYFPHQTPTKLLCAFPAIWVLFEWVRGWLFTGFPWLSVGYSQLHSPLKGYAASLGVYGVSLSVIISSSLVLLILEAVQQKQKKSLYINLARLAFIWIAGGCLSFVTWTKPQGAPIQVSLVQGNIAQDIKWSPEQVQPTLDHYQTLTEAHWDSNIIVWPEAAIPIPLKEAEDFINAIADKAKLHHSNIITGIPINVEDANTYYNAIVTLGEGDGFYLKRRLVPFGEYTPLPRVLHGLLSKLNIPMSDFIPGKQTPLFTVNNIKISPFLCYEIAFPEQVRSTEPDLGMLLTISNDAWFGRSIAQAQHLQIAAMRSLEMQRPALFVGNSGLTGIITADGNLQSVAPPYQTYVLTDKVQARSGLTPWQKTGMDPLLITLISLFITAIIKQRQKAG